MVIDSLPPLEATLEKPKIEPPPQRVWEVDVHVMRQLNTILALGHTKNPTFREPNSEQATKETIGCSPSPKHKMMALHVMNASLKDCSYTRYAFLLGKNDARVRQVIRAVIAQPEVLG